MKETLSIPNILSYIRIALIPVFAILFLTGNEYIALGIFVLASVTDVVDGFIARKFNMITNLGKVLDPLADKLLKVTVLSCLVYADKIPLWFLIVMVSLDLLLIISASILFKREVIIKSNFIGKSGTVIIALGILLSFFNLPYSINLLILYFGLLVVFLSVVSYLLIYLKVKENSKQS